VCGVCDGVFFCNRQRAEQGGWLLPLAAHLKGCLWRVAVRASARTDRDEVRHFSGQGGARLPDEGLISE
jgi:hypothetical protein